MADSTGLFGVRLESGVGVKRKSRGLDFSRLLLYNVDIIHSTILGKEKECGNRGNFFFRLMRVFYFKRRF